MSLHRSCSFHAGAYVQRGRGYGGTLWSLYTRLIPTLKSAGTKILESPVTQNILETAKNSAVNVGLNIAADTLGGQKVKKNLKRNLSHAKREIESALISGIGSTIKANFKGRGGAKRRKQEVDVFDDDELSMSE